MKLRTRKQIRAVCEKHKADGHVALVFSRKSGTRDLTLEGAITTKCAKRLLAAFYRRLVK